MTLADQNPDKKHVRALHRVASHRIASLLMSSGRKSFVHDCEERCHFSTEFDQLQFIALPFMLWLYMAAQIVF
jgi:hypothetical protein